MQKNITIISVVGSLLFAGGCRELKTNENDSISFQEITVKEADSIPNIDSISGSWIEIDIVANRIIEQMEYARSTNFINQQIYPCPKCFLRPEAAEALYAANRIVMDFNLRLVVFDCYRPLSLQRKMYELVENPKYVANPKNGGSMHNKGLAVDVALADSIGRLLDFGGAFDDFSDKSHHSFPDLSQLAKSNRRMLKEIMSKAGFSPYENEWWHYSYKNVQYNADDFVWNCD